MKICLSITSVRLFVLLLASAAAISAEPARILYQNDFEKAALGQVPDDFLVLNGDFSVKQIDGNKCLELPGEPLDTFGVLFGSATNSGVTVSARIYGTKKGRREPSFGVGLNGAAGYKLEVSPAKGALEIYKGDLSATNVPFAWKSGTWTMFRLQVRQDGNAWAVEGKAWPQSEPEPKDWMISIKETTAPHDGRPSIWGSPYSGTPIQFDDLTVTAD